MDEKMIAKAVREFRRSFTWRCYYDDAPSEACRRYIALEFYSGMDVREEDIEEADKEKKVLEAALDVKDWEHLLKYSGNNPGRVYMKNRIRELTERKA